MSTDGHHDVAVRHGIDHPPVARSLPSVEMYCRHLSLTRSWTMLFRLCNRLGHSVDSHAVGWVAGHLDRTVLCPVPRLDISRVLEFSVELETRLVFAVEVVGPAAASGMTSSAPILGKGGGSQCRTRRERSGSTVSAARPAPRRRDPERPSRDRRAHSGIPGASPRPASDRRTPPRIREPRRRAARLRSTPKHIEPAAGGRGPRGRLSAPSNACLGAGSQHLAGSTAILSRAPNSRWLMTRTTAAGEYGFAHHLGGRAPERIASSDPGDCGRGAPARAH